MPKLFERLMVVHYDPAYRRSTLRHFPEIDTAELVLLENLEKDALLKAARTLSSYGSIAKALDDRMVISSR